MPPHIFENVVCHGDHSGTALRSVQSVPRSANALHLAFLTVVAAAVVLPQLALASYALLTPAVRATILAKPMVSFQLLVALLFWIAIFLWPLSNLVRRISAHRIVEIRDGNVIVTERGAPACDAGWSCPLTAYKGIAHHIRSSLSGTRHELILVHPDPRQSVLLMADRQDLGAEIDRLSQSLCLPLVPARDLYPLARIRLPRLGRAQPLPA